MVERQQKEGRVVNKSTYHGNAVPAINHVGFMLEYNPSVVSHVPSEGASSSKCELRLSLEEVKHSLGSV